MVISGMMRQREAHIGHRGDGYQNGTSRIDSAAMVTPQSSSTKLRPTYPFGPLFVWHGQLQ